MRTRLAGFMMAGDWVAGRVGECRAADGGRAAAVCLGYLDSLSLSSWALLVMLSARRL
jgi:hypothetical protein